MTTNHDVLDAASGAILSEKLGKRTSYVLASAAEAQTLELAGVDVQSLTLFGMDFLYDSTDSTTPHDGTICLVTNDGKRFKRAQLTLVSFVVLDRGLSSPPAAPDIGDQYLLPSAPSGAWAGLGDNVVIYTARGWEAMAPLEGMVIYVSDEAVFVWYDGTEWQTGMGYASFADGEILTKWLEDGAGIIVQAEQNAPPASVPGVGIKYIVGSSPTGAWAGQAGKIARSTGAAWDFLTPQEGWRVFDVGASEDARYLSAAWVRGALAGGSGPTAGTTYTLKRLVLNTEEATPSISYAAEMGTPTATRSVCATVLLGGTITVTLSHRLTVVSGGFSSFVRVLKNGVQQAEWTTTSSAFVDRSLDITVDAGDLITIQQRTNNGGNPTAWRNVLIKSGRQVPAIA